MSKKISILGSTGSIGKQTLEVVSAFHSDLSVVALAAKDEVDLIAEQINKFKPQLVSVISHSVKDAVLEKINNKATVILVGEEGLLQVATHPKAETVVVAIPGATSLLPTLEAIRLGKTIALATKEILVAAGDLMVSEAAASSTKIFPIDSEHSAISQCLAGEDLNKVKRIILTASGGPFLNRDPKDFDKISVDEALAHPTWKMGPKITIDSATLLNKGFEVIEAHYLFGIDYSRIEVIVHPQSIIHSMVEFVDGSVMAQMGAPDMRIPIQYALLEKGRRSNLFKKLDLTEIEALTFAKADPKRFPCLELAYEAGRRGGTMGSVLNAAGEVAVARFLKKEISFPEIAIHIRKVISEHEPKKNPNLEDILTADAWARSFKASPT
ncbi:MAG: 1-deoxy-D-xylulose-5-phosphate reductoisomerase [Candidatus Saganbacteria bacterium]|nr:1-deoxy-D-xylulose-5-phosphate reductoisomerase [Candidatus Saganbacteria bacterium]